MSHRNNQITTQLESLSNLTLTQLRDRWSERFKSPPPPAARQHYLICALAHQIQEHANGGLAPSAQRRLAKLVAETTANESRAQPPRANLKPGSRLLREWQGTTHEVLVVDGGFAYRAKTYKSLSEIARKITGTRWSGPLFFGLRSTGQGLKPASQGRSFVVDLTCKTPSALKKQKHDASAAGAIP
jgi:hypothetical protein